MYRRPLSSKTLFAAVAYLVLISSGDASAQTVPEIGYCYPPTVSIGKTTATIGGYDWTTDLQIVVPSKYVEMKIVSDLGPMIVPKPPYWFGEKGRAAPFPIPRELTVEINVKSGCPEGPIEWYVANANGISKKGALWISSTNRRLESSLERKILNEQRHSVRVVRDLPTAICAQLVKISEVDAYRLKVTKDGPVTCRVNSVRFGSPMRALIRILDTNGRLIAETADTSGVEESLTFWAIKGHEYDVTVTDVDFRGNRQYVYEVLIDVGPRVVDFFPPVLKAGSKQEVTFVLEGVSAAGKTSEIKLQVSAPEGVTSLDFRVPTSAGESQSVALLVSDRDTSIYHADAKIESGEDFVGRFKGRAPHVYQMSAKKGQTYIIDVAAFGIGSQCDPYLIIEDSGGKQIAAVDDGKNVVDPQLNWKAPADGVFRLRISDLSASSVSRKSYRLSIRDSVEQGEPTLVCPETLIVPLGGKASVNLSVTPKNKDALAVSLEGLPAGFSPPEKIEIPAGKGQVKFELTSSDKSTSYASVATVTVEYALDGKKTTLSKQMVVVPRMKPRASVTPVDKDGGRTVHRGTTWPAEVIVKRLEDYKGDVILQMASKQGRHRQGIRGDDLLVPAGVTKTHYPVFMPEWLETSRTSRMVVNTLVKIKDPLGNERSLLKLMEGRITMSLEGALLKLGYEGGQVTQVHAGGIAEIPLSVARSAKFTEPVTLTLDVHEEIGKHLSATPVQVHSGQSKAVLKIATAAHQDLKGEFQVTIRAVGKQHGKYNVVSQTNFVLKFVGAE